MLRGAGICRRTNRSVLAVTRHLALKSSLDEPQGLHCPGLCCWARFHLPRQTVSSVRAGLPPLWFSALSPGPCSVPNMQFVFTKCLGRGQQPCRALPGCPLGGGRVLILHILSSSLSLFSQLRDMVSGYNPGNCGEKKKWLGSRAVHLLWSKISL